MPGKYEPVAYDVSISMRKGIFLLTIRQDDEVSNFTAKTLRMAQAMMDHLTPDIYSGPDVPWSVFYPSPRLAYALKS